ncbi:MAG TPA: AcvB/VirJ family lysyl-phosphatidylglycerol hydrolase, partial [Saprospiraceae bacterium]|nr:AcvB/VirJ family lysyl-phosphatidylglycerol hydrolase [Saprospiraceae bacterium]
FISGDGGWTGFDQQICDQLAAKHLPVVGLNSQSYFWKKKTPEQTVADLAPVIRQYLAAWGKSKLMLVGYSFGANVVPFIQNRLPDDLRGKVQSVVLLSPETKGDFEIHVAGMLGKGGGPYNVVAEVRSLQQTAVLCVCGDEEDNDVQTALQGAAHVRFEKIPGSHHYNNDAAKVAAMIISVQ